MSGRPRGRPRKNRNPRGREAAKLRLLKLSVSPPPERNPSPLPLESPSGIRGLTDEQSRYAALLSQDYGITPLSFASSTTEAPLFLDKIKRLGPVWKPLGRISTIELPNWFDAQKNDFNCRKAHTRSELVSLTFFGYPGDSPLDIRARPFVAQWKESGLLSSRGKLEAIQQERVIMRWEYSCRGICSVQLDRSDLGDSNDGKATMSRDDGAENESRRGRWDLCNGNVRLVVELTADDLTHANIWQWSSHPDAVPEQGLNWSRRLRNLVSERLQVGGATVSTMEKELVAQYGFPADSSSHGTRSVPEFPHQLPEFRRPTSAQLRSMVTAFRRREKLNKAFPRSSKPRKNIQVSDTGASKTAAM